MKSKEFWDKLLESANKYMPEEYPIVMSEDPTADIPKDCEGRVFRTIWKDGNTYGKGLYFPVEMIPKGIELAEHEGYMLANSMKYCFENIEAKENVL